MQCFLSPSPLGIPGRLKVRKTPLTSSHTEQHSEDFAEQRPETDNSGHLHTIQIAFDFGYPGTCCHWLPGERRMPVNPKSTDSVAYAPQPR